MAGNVWGQRVIAGIRGQVGGEGFINIKEIGVGAQFVSTVVVVAIRELAGEIGQQDRCSRSAGKIVVPEAVGELMGIAEFSADFDSGRMGAQVITLGRRSGALEIQLSGESVTYLHAAQREIALVGVGLGKAGGRPLGEVEALRVGQIILAGTRW